MGYRAKSRFSHDAANMSGIPGFGHMKTVQSGQDLHCLLIAFPIKNLIKIKKKKKKNPNTPRIENGLFQLIKMGKSTCLI